MNESLPSAESVPTPDDGWEPTRWWQVRGPDGELWCETSDESEARERMRPGDTLRRLYSRTEYDWQTCPTTPGAIAGGEGK